MSFLIENIDAATVSIDDIGITLDIGETYDLIQEEAAVVALSVDLPAAITGGTIQVIDPNASTTPLSTAEALLAIAAMNDTHYGIKGGKIDQIGDVVITGTGSPPEPGSNHVLRFNTSSGDWENISPVSLVPGWTSIQGNTGTATAVSAGETVSITGNASSSGIRTVATAGSPDVISLILELDRLNSGTTLALTDEIAVSQGVSNTVSFTIQDIADTIPGASDQNLWETVTSDAGSTTANTITDTLTIAGGTGISTAVAGDTLTITNDSPNVDQNLFETIAVSGQSNVIADTTTDTLTLVAGTNVTITTDAGADSITINATDTGDPDQNLWETVTGDSGSTTANIITDNLTIAGGTGISTAVAGDTLTITNDSPNVDQNLFLNFTDGANTAVADTITDTFTFTAGAGITAVITPGTDTLTITNTLPNVDQNLWETVTGDAGSTTANTITDTLTIAGGTGITTAITGDTLTITNSAPNVDQNLFQTIAVPSGGPLVADTITDTLTFTQSAGIGITGTAGTDTINIAPADDLAAIEALATTGIAVRTAADTWVTRSVVASTTAALEGADVVNGNGVAGNPSIGIDIDNLANSGNDLVATDEFIVFDSTNNVSMSGQQLADGVSTILGGVGDPDQNLWETVTGDAGSTTANTITDTLTIAGGAGISTAVAGDTLTITNDSPNVDQNLFSTIAPDTGSNAVADTTTDTLTLQGGLGITTVGTVNDTIDIQVTTDLAAIELLAGTGIAVRTAADTWAQRTITASTTAALEGADVVNGDGVAGNPLIGIDIDNLANHTGNLTAAEELIIFDSTNNVSITGQQLADGVATLIGTTLDQNLFQTIAVSGQSNVVADTTTDTLTLVAGTNVTITTDAGTDTITINAAGGAGDPDQNLWETITADTGSTTADTITDTLTVTGGTGISTTIVGDTLTVDVESSAASLASVCVSRTTTFALSTPGFADITWDTTDIESDASILEHNNTNTDNIDIKEDGLYLVSYSLSVDADAGEETLDFHVRVNDTTILSCSERTISEDDEINAVTCVFPADLTSGDFITLRGAASGGGNIFSLGHNFTVIRLRSIAGPPGTAGTGSSAVVQARDVTQDFAVPTAWTDFVWDTTDVETNAATVEHNNTNADDIDIKVDGDYRVSWHMSCDDEVGTRVRLNDTTVLPGSTALSGDVADVNQIISQNSGSFIAAGLVNGDKLTFQVIAQTGGELINPSSTTVAHDPIFIVEKMNIKGDAGGVDSSANIVDHSIVRGDGGVMDVQDSDTAGVGSWTIADTGQIVGSGSQTGFIADITNTLATGGGNGLQIKGGELNGDIALRLEDADGTFNILDIEADSGLVILGSTYAAAAAGSPINVFGFDNRNIAGNQADFNTQNGVYRIAGVPLAINDLGDVDTVTTTPTTGDRLEFDGTDWVPVSNLRPTFCIVAEENGAVSVSANNYEYSFGNGGVNVDTDPSGIPVGVACTLIAISISANNVLAGTSSFSVSVTNNGTAVATGGIATGGVQNAQIKDTTQVTPDTVNFAVGDTVNFLTASAVGTLRDVRVCAWFERTA